VVYFYTENTFLVGIFLGISLIFSFVDVPPVIQMLSLSIPACPYRCCLAQSPHGGCRTRYRTLDQPRRTDNSAAPPHPWNKEDRPHPYTVKKGFRFSRPQPRKSLTFFLHRRLSVTTIQTKNYRRGNFSIVVPRLSNIFHERNQGLLEWIDLKFLVLPGHNINFLYTSPNYGK
jgi:hypothetical protein